MVFTVIKYQRDIEANYQIIHLFLIHAEFIPRRTFPHLQMFSCSKSQICYTKPSTYGALRGS